MKHSRESWDLEDSSIYSRYIVDAIPVRLLMLKWLTLIWFFSSAVCVWKREKNREEERDSAKETEIPVKTTAPNIIGAT